MTENKDQGELQQLVIMDEEQGSADKFGEVTPPVSPAITKTSPESIKDVSSSGGYSARGVASIGGSSSSRSLSRIVTVPALGSSHTSNVTGSSTRFIFVNEKQSNRPPRPAHPPPANRLKRVGLLERPVQHHCFLSDVTDVRRMETALLSLLEDFHSGNLKAFGKDCSMEEMTGIREQQERLAKLHFELGASRDLYAPLSDEGLQEGKQNMAALMASLEQLSESIEKLHTFSSSHES
ncbi:coiled-coil domain-containing protein 28A isoform X1 [Halyomorpha halys]|uniref:coiled-coil domain-containing protein 28A isoform X1 n=1 Tax=Halyomorpha halys TaxID=286706 RepID=UPI0006D4C79E|nr:coiled-coil domain-containing protein 28A [Halyomorpha halys]